MQTLAVLNTILQGKTCDAVNMIVQVEIGTKETE